jgi:hypothetical protein
MMRLTQSYQTRALVPTQECKATGSSGWAHGTDACAIKALGCREIGLSTMLGAARTLLKDDFLREEDLQRLMQSLSMIRSEFRYENVEFDTMRAVTVSLVRAECVKLAAALKGRAVDDGTLQGWDDEAQSDPLPEVRFALAED